MNNYLKILLALLTIIITSDIYGQEDDSVEEVVVISSKTPVPLSEVVGSVTLITQDDLENRLVADLGDVLQNSVGISVPRNSQYGRYYNEGISIRGLGGSKVNIFVDGVRVSDAYAGYGRDVVDVDLLKRVEVLKGPTSALYGSDGLAGAVSFITKDASDYVDNGTHFTGRYAYNGDSDQTKISMLSAFSGQRLEGLMQVVTREASEVSLHDDAMQDPNPVRSEGQSVLMKLKYDLNDLLDVTFVIDHQEWNSDITVNTDIGSAFYPGISTLSTTSASVGQDEGSRDRIGVKIDINSGNELFDNGTLNFYSQNTDQQQITNKSVADMVFGQFGPMGPPSIGALFRDYQFNQSVSGMSIEMFKSLMTGNLAHNIVYGYEAETLETERLRISTLTNVFTGVVSTNIYGTQYPNKTLPNTDTTRTGLYINDRITLDEHTVLSMGIRYDTYELEPKDDVLSAVNRAPGYPLAEVDEQEMSAKLGLLTDLGNNLSMFVQYAEGFKAPDYDAANLSFNNLAYGYGIVPNANLRPETSTGKEVGFRRVMEDRSWSITRFSNSYDDFIDSVSVGYDFINSIALLTSANLNDVEIDGMEISFARKINDNLDFSLDMIRTSGKTDGAPLSSLDPDESIVGLKHKSNDGKLSTNFFITFVDASFDGFTSGCGRGGGACVTLPDREIFDLYSTYEVNDNLQLNLALKNLSDQKYWNWSTVNGFAADQANLDLWLEPGRNISASVKISF